MFEGARTLQIAWFLAGDFPCEAEKFFEGITGIKPHTVQHARPPHAPVPQSMLIGVRNEIQYRLHIQPGRADLYFEPDAAVFQSGVSFPVINNANNVRDVLILSGIDAAPLLTNVYRIGLNIIYSSQFDSWELAGEAFAEAIPQPTVFPVSRDAIYQLNVRVESEGFEFNRILKWATDQGQFIEMSVSPNGQGQSRVVREANFVTYQIDLNNVGSNHILTSNEQVRILNILKSEAARLFDLKNIEEL